MDAINPKVLIEKTPDLQYVVLNGTATFTIKVTNTGDVALSNVSVTDTLAPDCNRSAAQIGILQSQRLRRQTSSSTPARSQSRKT